MRYLFERAQAIVVALLARTTRDMIAALISNECMIQCSFLVLFTSPSLRFNSQPFFALKRFTAWPAAPGTSRVGAVILAQFP